MSSLKVKESDMYGHAHGPGLGHRIPIMTVSGYSDSTTHCQDGLFGQPSVPLLTCVHPQKELIILLISVTTPTKRTTNQHNTAHPGLAPLVYVLLPYASLRMRDLLHIVAKHSNPEYVPIERELQCLSSSPVNVIPSLVIPRFVFISNNT